MLVIVAIEQNHVPPYYRAFVPSVPTCCASGDDYQRLEQHMRLLLRDYLASHRMMHSDNCNLAALAHYVAAKQYRHCAWTLLEIPLPIKRQRGVAQ